MTDKPPLVINSVPFTPIPDQGYPHDYLAIARDIVKKKLPEKATYRTLCMTDLWFLVYFGLRTTIANHPFWIHSCYEVQTGPKTDTLDLWARDHGKSTIITIAETIQDILKDPNERVCIYSYTKDTAKVFFGAIRQHFEHNAFLKDLFDDILWEKTSDAPQWNDQGIVVKRPTVFKEATVEAWGLTEGMPTGRHFTKRKYDDIMTQDLVNSPAMMERIKANFDMSEHTGCEGGTRRVVGTYYHHEDPLTYIAGQKTLEGKPVFTLRIKPGTEDGTYNGRPVWLSQDRIDKLKVNRKQFATQVLLNPTPPEDEKLPWHYIRHVTKEELPQKCFKFMTVDPAGGKREDGREPDSWGIWVCAIEPYIGDEGASKLFILDGFVGVVRWDEGVKLVTEMYLRNGFIHRLGVEKVGQSTFEVHVSNALRAKGRLVTLENKMLHILKPEGRKKEQRIEGNLGPPLRNGLIHMVDTISPAARDRLREEMERYPMWKFDGLDSLAYQWDLMRDFRFPTQGQMKPLEKKEEDLYDRIFNKRRQRKQSMSWMAA